MSERDVTIRIRVETFCKYTGPKTVDISRERVKELGRKYGTQGISWYPVSTTRIKAFDAEADRWVYEGLRR